MRQPRNFATDRCCHLVARTANGVRHTYEYDGRGQLLAVKNADGNAVERYAYDKAGNMLKKQILRSGRAGAPRTPQSDDYITTTFAFDAANQLVSSTTDGLTTRYAYDAAGRMVREGNKTYRYGYLDKVLSVTDGDTIRTYTYHADGQLATANYGRAGAHPALSPLRGSLRSGDMRTPQTETFLWDGLALIQRGDEQFMNEPHVGGGNPVASSSGTTYFNDMLGTTVGSKSNGRYSAAALTAFGEDLTVHSPTPTQNSNFFTGKPFVEGLGHAFLMRNYRAGLAKWQTADPMGYPDGWNQLAYCGNGVTQGVDLWGCAQIVVQWSCSQSFNPGILVPAYNSEYDAISALIEEAKKAGMTLKDYVKSKIQELADGKGRAADVGYNVFLGLVLKAFATSQCATYIENPALASDWNIFYKPYVQVGWTMVSYKHLGVKLEEDDTVKAGLSGVIVDGCTHYWDITLERE